MGFFDHFSADQRQRFEAAGQVLDLQRGAYLMRRGEAGGDVFLLREGRLEVVDGRSTPELILATFTPGAMVGEMAFIDDAPRSADVRAASDSVVTQWPRQDLHALLAREPDLAATFYRAIARLAAERIRTVTTTALAGAYTRARTVSRAGLARIREEARLLADPIKEGLLEVERRLRSDPGDAQAQVALRGLLERLQDDVRTLFVAHPEPGAGDEAAAVLTRELHPYLVRSALAERCIRRPQGVTATAEILSHVLVDTPGGDGQLGELLDRWLLDRPTCTALRSFRGPLVELVAASLPRHRNRRVLVLNAGTGSLVAGLMEAIHQPPTVLTVIDQSRDALAFLDASVAGRPGVELVTVQENLAQFALGRRRHNFVHQDVVVVHGLVEYLPDRLVVSLFQVLARMIAPGGVVAVTGLAHSPDDTLLDRVLAWPTIRRSLEDFRRLLDGAGFGRLAESALPAPALLLHGSPDATVARRFSYTPALAPDRASH